MGKVRRNRQKFHHTIKKPQKLHKDFQEFISCKDNEDIKNSKSSQFSNLFDGISITEDILKQQLPDFDQLSVKSIKSEGMQLSKKDKRALKHELFMKKINAIEKARQNLRETEKRRKMPVVGDMKPLKDALPTLELLSKKSTDEKKKQISSKPLASRSSFAKKKALLEDIAIFHQVINDDSFKQNPAEVIKTYLKNKYQYDDMET